MRDVVGARDGVDNVEGAKAGNKQKKPYRAPVSVTSSQTMRIKYGISEGTILGFGRNSTYNDMLKRIFLDGTPIMSAEGEQLLDVVVEFRDGAQDQEPINGLPSITIEHNVGVEVRLAAPVSRSFTRSDTTSYDIRVSVPQLYEGTDDGTSNAGRIEFKIDVSTDGGAFVEAGRFVIVEKILNGYTDTFNIDVPQGANHVVRVSRLNAEGGGEFAVNKLIVDAIIENTDTRLRYSNTAILYLEYDAEQFNNTPKLEVRVFGKNDILIPANYDAETRQYATTGAGTTGGVWNGTWKRDYTDNPVWIWLDLLTATRYGLGDKITLDTVNKWELYGIAQYCDQSVADGSGGQEPRFTCNNVYLQKSEDAFRVLKDLAASFRAKTVWDGEYITLLADTPRDPVMTFSNANVKDLTYSSTQDSAQRNLINVQYYDKENKFSSDVVMHRSTSNILSRGKVVDGNFTALGCTSQGQAQRIASYVMNSELYETEIVSFTTGLEGTIPRLNDVIYLADSSIAGRVIGGRVAAVAGNSITLDRKLPDEVQAIPSTQLVINREIKKTEPVSVISISADRLTVTLATSPPAGTEAGLVWALITQDLVPQKFTITDVKFQPDEMTFAISALQYNDSKYAAIDGSARIVVPPISVVEHAMLKPPLAVIASYLVRIVQDASVCDIDVSWSQSRNAVQYQLEMQKEGSEWRIVGRFQSYAMRLDNMYTGTYTFRACAYDSLGNASPYTYSDPILVAGKVLPPPQLIQYSVIGVLFGYKHDWTYPAHTEDSRSVRLRYTLVDPTATPDQQWQYVDIAYPTAAFTEQDVSVGLRTWFSAAIVDKYGSVGAYTGWQGVVPSSDPAAVLDLLDGQLTSSQLDQSLRDQIALGGEASEDAAAAKLLAQAATDKINNEVVPQLEQVEDGLSQEKIERQSGDSQVVGQLNTYQLSNDAKVITALDTATAAMNASGVNASNITAMQGRLTNLDGTVQQQGLAVNLLEVNLTNLDGTVTTHTNSILSLQGRTTTLENDMVNKLEASALENYYTKQQTGDVAAGYVQEFKAKLAVSARNLVRNTAYPHSGYFWMYQELLTRPITGEITISFMCELIGGGALESGVGWCNGDGGATGYGFVWNPVLDTGRFTWTGVPPASGLFTHFGIYANNSVRIYDVQIVAGNANVAWSPAPEDTTIGGENLIADAALTGEPVKYKGFGVKRALVAANSGLDTFYTAILPIADSREYVLSFDAKASVAGAKLQSYFYLPDNTIATVNSQGRRSASVQGDSELVLSTEMTRYWVKWTQTATTAPKQVIIARGIAGTADILFEVCRAKLEIGGTPTDFSIAPLTTVSGIQANADAINQTNVNVTNVDNRLTAEATKIENLRASVGNLPAGGGNLLLNGDFSLRTTQGWAFESYAVTAPVWSVLKPDGVLQEYQADAGQSRTIAVYSDADHTAQPSAYMDLSQTIPVISGKSYQLSAYTGVHRSKVILFVLFYDSNNAYIGNSSGLVDASATNAAEAGGGKTLGSFKRLRHNIIAPAACVSFKMLIRTTPYNAPYVFVTRAMCAEISSLSAGLVPWIEASGGAAFQGNETKVQVTELDNDVQALSVQTNTLSTTVGNNTASITQHQSSLNGLEAKATIQVAAGGTVGGIALGNNGGVVDFIVRSNTFAIAPPVGVADDTSYAFAYQSTDITLPNGTVIPKGLKVTDAMIGVLNTDKIYAASLSAMAAEFGTWTSTDAQGNRRVVTGASVKVYNAAGILLMEEGIG